MKTPVEFIEIELKGIYESDYLHKIIKQAKVVEAKEKAIEAKKNFLEGFNSAKDALSDLYDTIETQFNNHRV
jgi:hypothetical protein